MAARVDTEYLRYLWPMRSYLISCGSVEEPNLIAVSFCMPVSASPPLLACAVGSRTYSAELLNRTGELIVNVPGSDLARQILFCGTHSGRDVDKFAATGLTPVPGRSVGVPAVGQCPAQMEARVVSRVSAGEKVLYVARVVEAYALPGLAEGRTEVQWSAGGFPQAVYGGRFE